MKKKVLDEEKLENTVNETIVSASEEVVLDS